MFVAIECRYSRKACLRHWTVLNCLIIKALRETRTYFACERGLSLNRIFYMSWPLKLAYNWNIKAFFVWVSAWRTAVLPITLLPILLLPYCLLRNLKIPKNRPPWNAGITRVSEVLEKLRYQGFQGHVWNIELTRGLGACLKCRTGKAFKGGFRI